MKLQFNPSYEFLDFEIEDTERGSIFYLYLKNPSARNAMTWKMGEEFYDLIQTLRKQKEKPRVLILSGRGAVFSAGGDLQLLRSFAEKTYAQNKRDMRKFYKFFLSIRELPIPTIAAVNGHAIGAGLSLTFACDLRVYAIDGKYSFNFVKLGIHPGMGSSYLAPKMLGESLGKRVLFTAETFDGTFAKEKGLAMVCVPKDEVVQTAKEIALDLIKAAPLALAELKQNGIEKQGLEKALRLEARSQAKNFLSLDFRETIQSILEKREPKFQGR